MSQSEARYQRCRRQAIAAVQRGEPATAVARVMNLPRRTLFAWLARYRAGGWQALREGRRPAKPRKLSGPAIQRLHEAISQGETR